MLEGGVRQGGAHHVGALTKEKGKESGKVGQ